MGECRKKLYCVVLIASAMNSLSCTPNMIPLLDGNPGVGATAIPEKEADCSNSTDICINFSRELRDLCLKNGGGKVCESNRWNRKFYEDLAATLDASRGVEKPLLSSGSVLLRDVPYLAQRDNSYDPGATCGVTSAAMLLRSRGDNVTPDELFRLYGKSAGQSPAELGALFKKRLGNSYYTSKGTYAEVRSYLDKGQAVVMHGWLTNSGHVVLAVGYDAKGLIFNDPAGKWLGRLSEFDTTRGAGKQVHYSYDILMRKYSHPIAGSTNIFGDDGDVWFSTAR